MELFSLAGGSHAPTAGMVDPDKIQSRTESQLHQIWDEEADTRARILELCNSQTEPPTQADHRATTAARDIYRYYMEREDDKSQHTRPGQTARQQESQTSQAEQSARTSVCKTQEDDPTFGKVREALKDYLDDKTLAERLGVLQASPSKSPSNEEVTLGDWLKRNTEANHVHEDDLTV